MMDVEERWMDATTSEQAEGRVTNHPLQDTQFSGPIVPSGQS
jgi:hypothetical protein